MCQVHRGCHRYQRTLFCGGSTKGERPEGGVRAAVCTVTGQGAGRGARRGAGRCCRAAKAQHTEAWGGTEGHATLNKRSREEPKPNRARRKVAVGKLLWGRVSREKAKCVQRPGRSSVALTKAEPPTAVDARAVSSAVTGCHPHCGADGPRAGRMPRSWTRFAPPAFATPVLRQD